MTGLRRPNGKAGNQRTDRRQTRTLVGVGLLAILFLGIALAMFDLLLGTRTAFAMGHTEIARTDPSVEVVFSAARTDDPRGSIDPGLDLDVASCRARVKAGKILLTILNGYPGYSCTMRATIKNRGKQTAWLQSLEVDAPPGFTITGPQYPSGFKLAPRQRKTQNFSILIGPEVEQGTSYQFYIREVFGPTR